MKKKLDFWGVASFLLVAAFGASAASANVSLRNGNFFVGYTDIFYPGGFEPKIERVYNSKTLYSGMFGYGWGTEYEAYLTVSADGSVVVHEYGGGAENRFTPVGFKQSDLEKAVDTITEVKKGTGALGNATQVAQYKKQLLSDAFFRNDEWQKFIKLKKLQPRRLANGTQLVSNRFSYQYITKVQEGYKRTFDSGRTEVFNEQGRLLQITDKNNNFIKFAYGADGHLASLVDNFNRKIFFTFNNLGLLEKLEGENKKTASYQYNKNRELVQSRDVEGNVFGFRYSDDQHHNLTQISYSDKTTMDVAYYGKDLYENVKSIKDRDGTVTEYGYRFDNRDRGHFTVSVHVKSKEAKLVSNSEYEYFLKTKANGEQWTYRLISSVDGDKSDTTYSEEFGLPISIRKNKELTTFKYDRKGHVIHKETPTEVSSLQYHKVVGKVTSVERYSKLTKRKSWSKFDYDGKGNLVTAQNSDQKRVKLVYDLNGRISSLVDQNKKRVIHFKYNENSKPIEIRDPNLGTIKVTYNNSGEVKDVESSAGRRIALQVTSAFQDLLDIIRPAGVTLSF